MRPVLFIGLALASLALAQTTGVVRGNALKRPEYQTYSALDLYVDGEVGSDTNACTAAGAQACATITSALSRVPKMIRHTVTVNVAGASDGGVRTYTENLTLSGFTLTATGGLAITGPSLVQAVLPFGNGGETGTLTGIASTTGLTPAYVTLSNSMNNVEMFGYFIDVTRSDGGSSLGLFNHNDVVTGRQYLSSALSPTPVVGDAYVIRVPAVNVNGDVTLINNVGTIVLQRLTMSGVSTGTGRVNVTRGTVQLLNSTVSVSGGQGLWVGSEATALVTGSSLVSSGSGNAVLLAPTSQATVSFTAPSQVGLLSTSSVARAMSHTSGVASIRGNYSVRHDFAAAARPAISLTGLGTSMDMPVYIACGQSDAIAANHTGIRVSSGNNAISIGNVNMRGSNSGLNGFFTKGCETGFAFEGPVRLTHGGTNATPSTGCNYATTCFNLVEGAGAWFAGTYTLTSSNTTTDISLDGVAYTFAFLNGLSPQRIVEAKGSSIQRR